MVNVIITTFVFLVSLIFYVNFVASSRHTLKLENGQTFKCIDLHKQPVFRNSPISPELSSKLIKLQRDQKRSFGLTGLGSHRGCPIGTVPVLEHSKSNSNDTYHQVPEDVQPTHAGQFCSARVETKKNPGVKFYGGMASIAIYKLDVPDDQWTASKIQVASGEERIETGWMVNPRFFKDTESHLYVMRSVKDRGLDRGCTNLDCPFVQVSSEIPLGFVPATYSTPDKQHTWALSIERLEDKYWWVSITGMKHKIGYWPVETLTSLQVSAETVGFGGFINNPETTMPATPMGNGYMAEYDTTKSAYIYKATVVNSNFSNVNPPDTFKIANCPDLYTVLDNGIIDDPYFGRIIYYGGPVLRT